MTDKYAIDITPKPKMPDAKYALLLTKNPDHQTSTLSTDTILIGAEVLVLDSKNQTLNFTTDKLPDSASIALQNAGKTIATISGQEINNIPANKRDEVLSAYIATIENTPSKVESFKNFAAKAAAKAATSPSSVAHDQQASKDHIEAPAVPYNGGARAR